MRFFVIIAGVIHALAPEADRQLRRNESEPTRHPLIDQLDLRVVSRQAALRPLPEPVPTTTVYIGGRYFERSCA